MRFDRFSTVSTTAAFSGQGLQPLHTGHWPKFEERLLQVEQTGHGSHPNNSSKKFGQRTSCGKRCHGLDPEQPLGQGPSGRSVATGPCLGLQGQVQ